MKALSLTAPWSVLVALGQKRIETRSWPTPFRGPLAIHSAKTFPEDAQELCFAEPFLSALGHFGLAYVDRAANKYIEHVSASLGCVVATCHLSACVPTSELLRLGIVGDREEEFGNYSDGRFGFVLEEIRFLAAPVPALGALGLWDVPSEVEEEIHKQGVAKQ